MVNTVLVLMKVLSVTGLTSCRIPNKQGNLNFVKFFHFLSKTSNLVH